MIQEPESLSKQKESQPPETDPQDARNETGEKDGKRPKRPEPTRYGDWEKNGRCIDF